MKEIITIKGTVIFKDGWAVGAVWKGPKSGMWFGKNFFAHPKKDKTYVSEVRKEAAIKYILAKYDEWKNTLKDISI